MMTPEKLLGQQLGPYQIEEILGSGGMAVVYRARGVESQEVALKVLFPPPGAESELRLRFQREARTAARLRHPGIVPVLEAGQAEGCAYLAMPFVEGQTLAAHLTQQLPQGLDEATAADIACLANR
jgi:serine/threonine protein kinase